MNKPYGSTELINNAPKNANEVLEREKQASKLKSFIVPEQYLSDCEMIATGGFTPLTGFMTKAEIDNVVHHMQLPNGLVWGIPIIMLVTREQASSIKLGEKISLLNEKKDIIAIMDIRDKFEYDKKIYSKEIYKTDDQAHPGVSMLFKSPDVFLGGPITLVNRPSRVEISKKYYLEPIQTRTEFKKRNWSTIVAFQTRNPIHRAHEYLIKCAMETIDGVLIHPLVGKTKSDDIPSQTRMQCYEQLITHYFNPNKILLSVLPTYMRYAGPREAINHAIIRKNYGCTHFIVGRDHAGVGNYYGTYEAQELLSSCADKIGIQPLNFEHAFFCKKCGEMATSKTCPHGQEFHIILSGTKVRDLLKEGKRPPIEFSRKEVVDILIEWASNK